MNKQLIRIVPVVAAVALFQGGIERKGSFDITESTATPKVLITDALEKKGSFDTQGKDPEFPVTPNLWGQDPEYPVTPNLWGQDPEYPVTPNAGGTTKGGDVPVITG